MASPKEKWEVHSLSPNARVEVIPNGVDLKTTPFVDVIKTNPAARIKTTSKEKDPDALLKILWRGSMTHMEDLDTIGSFWKWAAQHKGISVGWIGILNKLNIY